MARRPVSLFRAASSAAKRLLRKTVWAWYHAHGRDLPWRRTADPYWLLTAEVMLQQTDAAKVSAAYPRFIRDFPRPSVLAEAKESRVAGHIRPLGLNYRAGRLIATAKAICEEFGGEVPKTEEELMSMPGIGRYVARAVLAGAAGRRLAVLDTNVVRLLERYFGVRSQRPRPHTDPQLWEVAQLLLPRRTSDSRDWNYAVLDFTAGVCTYSSPSCDACGCSRRCRRAARSLR